MGLLENYQDLPDAVLETINDFSIKKEQGADPYRAYGETYSRLIKLGYKVDIGLDGELVDLEKII